MPIDIAGMVTNVFADIRKLPKNVEAPSILQSPSWTVT
jgi:hypothetical protein